jgi:hypothetical protein
MAEFHQNWQVFEQYPTLLVLAENRHNWRNGSYCVENRKENHILQNGAKWCETLKFEKKSRLLIVSKKS